MPFEKRKLGLIGIVVLVVGIGTVAFLFLRRAKPNAPTHTETTSKQEKITEEVLKEVGLESLVAGPCLLQTYVPLIGKVDFHPTKVVRLHAKAPGVAVQVLRAVGDDVRSGETLAMIENNVGIQTYPLVSPIQGTIINRDVGSGQSVTEADELFTIGDTKFLQAKFFVGSRDLPKLKVDQEILLLTDRRRPVKSKIVYVSQVLDPTTRTAVALANTDSTDLKPGLNVSGAAVSGTAEAKVCLPIELVDTRSSDHKATIFLDASGQFLERGVRLGRQDFLNVEVVEGLEPNGRVIKAASETVRVKLTSRIEAKHKDGHEEGHDDHEE